MKALARRDVLDQGYVALFAHQGTDADIAFIARNSTGQDQEKLPDEDEKLLRHLFRHAHTSPFEFTDYIFQIHCPIFVARQLVRHRTASMNEWSARYIELPQMFHYPSEFRLQPSGKHQGSSDEVLGQDDCELAKVRVDAAYDKASRTYEQLLEMGVSKEQARTVLPVGTYTQFFWKMDLHNLLHFLGLRLDPHAQKEIRVFAEAIYEFVKEYNPQTAQAFEDYKLNAASFSHEELMWIRQHLVEGSMLPLVWTKREQEEFVAKMAKGRV